MLLPLTLSFFMAQQISAEPLQQNTSQQNKIRQNEQSQAALDWIDRLRPSADVQFLYEERREKNNSLSGLSLGASLLIRPSLGGNWEWGTELRTTGEDLSLIRARVGSQNGFQDFKVALSQAYIAYRYREFANQEIILNFGKSVNPFNGSPLLWDQELRPEGFYQSFRIEFPENRMEFKLHAGQWNADRSAESLVDGRALRRFWMFQQGLEFRWQPNPIIDWRLGGASIFFTEASESIVRASANGGARVVFGSDGRARFSENYSPVELYSEFRALPLGIPTGLAVAASVNFRTKDRARGLYSRLSIGNSWIKKGLEARLEWMYLEPHVQIAYFTDGDWGNANRHSGRAQMFVGFSPSIRARLSALYSRVIEDRASQSNRFHALGGIELQWR
jgi:hypothetical protein